MDNRSGCNYQALRVQNASFPSLHFSYLYEHSILFILLLVRLPITDNTRFRGKERIQELTNSGSPMRGGQGEAKGWFTSHIFFWVNLILGPTVAVSSQFGSPSSKTRILCFMVAFLLQNSFLLKTSVSFLTVNRNRGHVRDMWFWMVFLSFLPRQTRGPNSKNC